MHYTRILTKPKPPPYHNGSIGKRPYTTKVKKRREIAIGHTLNKRCIDLAVKNSLVKVKIIMDFACMLVGEERWLLKLNSKIV